MTGNIFENIVITDGLRWCQFEIGYSYVLFPGRVEVLLLLKVQLGILTVDPRQRNETVTAVMEVIFWEAASVVLCNKKNYDRLELEKKGRTGERPLQGIINIPKPY